MSQSQQTMLTASMSVTQRKIALMSSKTETGDFSSFQQTLRQILTLITPAFNKLLAYIDIIAPYVVKMFALAQSVYKFTPINIIEAVYGLALCFFGGFFPLTIAAMETFRVSGGDRVMRSLQLLWIDVKAVHVANQADNKKDDDGDGVADVDQISAQQLVTRKAALFLRTVNPERILQATGALAQAFAGVISVLKIQFARVISLAVSISDNIRPVLAHLLAPALVALIPKEYHHWIFPTIDVISKLLGGSVAWFLFRVIAAVHSGIVGGLACSRALLRYANNMKWIELDCNHTMIDEFSGWFLAACGVWFQISHGMSLPFPLNILLLPVNLCETYLQWAVTWMGASP